MRSYLFFILLLSACTHKTPWFKHSKPKSDFQENHIVIIVPSYNNSEWYRFNLDSILSQNYTNFEAFYIDDCSTDNTGILVKNYIKKHTFKNITLILNKRRHGALANIWNAIQQCRPTDIIINLDGDDWFSHTNVLSTINTFYQTNDIWLTYGQFQNWPTQKIGWCKPVPSEVIKNNQFREFGFWYAQPRTYYAWLAQKIQPKDLVNPKTNDFYTIAGDVALMFPLIEMAGNHSMHIPEVLCYRNVKTALNDFKIHQKEQITFTEEIKKKNKYLPLEKSDLSV